jgi:UDP-4-amino-4,6-dideoxy-N-acetyl-beta-L-altrosamine transaminase
VTAVTPLRLPYGRQCIEDDDIAAVVAALKSPWLTTGPQIAAFEGAFRARCGAPHAVSCANGTAALHLAAMALGLGEGDAVVVPAVTFLATANAARYVGAEVVFADVDPLSGLMTAETLEAALGRAAGAGRLRAVFPVHMNGHSTDMGALRRVAERLGMAIVEDACHALGGEQRDVDGRIQPVGACTASDMATFSFHAVKGITMGEGGAVTTRDARLARRLAIFRNHGMTRAPQEFELGEGAFDSDGQPNPWHYEMPEPGYNYRASDIQCALGLSQLKKFDRFLAARERLAARYDSLLSRINAPIRPVSRDPTLRSGWHLYVVHIDFAGVGKSRADVMRELAADEIGTQVHYYPVCHQPYYRRRYGVQSVPGADAYFARALSLPLFPAMDEGDVDYVVERLRRVLSI